MFEQLFRDSGQEWLGAVPSRWQLHKLGAHFTERKVTVNDTDYPALSVTMQGIVPQLEAAAKSDANDKRKLVLKGDFVINSRSDRKGSSGISPLDGSVSQIAIVLEPKDVSPQYAHYLMRSYSFQEEFYKWGSGIVADLWSTRFSAMKQIVIPVPPIAEQDAIVEFLDRELEQIDSLVEKQKKLVELSKERLRSAISGATSPPVSCNSGKWREAKVSELGTLTNGYPFDSNTFSHEGELPLVRIRDLKASEFETYIPKGSCPQSHLVQDGDLLIGMDGDFNAVLWSRGLAALNQRVARLRFKSPDVATYVVFAIQDKLDRINDLTYSTTVKHLSSGQITNIKIAMPPAEELSDKAKRLTQLAKSMGEIVSVSENLVATLIERRQALISAAVTGKLELEGAR